MFGRNHEAVTLPPLLEGALLGELCGGTWGVRSQALYGERLKRLWPLLAKEGGRATSDERHYSLDRSLVEAYALYYFTANVMKLPLILDELAALGWPMQGDQRWLDVGTGPGTAVLGAWHWAHERGMGGSWSFTAVDRAPEFLALARRLASRVAKDSGVLLPLATKVFDAACDGRNLQRLIASEGPTVVSFCNTLGEWGVDDGAREESMAAALKTFEGLALIVEPASKASSRSLLELRRRLLAREDLAGRLAVLTPCLSERPCGALAASGDWCHEEAPFEAPSWHAALGAVAGLRKEQLLFSYLALAVGPKAASARQAARWPVDGKRVVSQRLVEKGLVKCHVCTADGKRQARVLDSRRCAENEVFVASGRGEVFSELKLDEKGSVLKAQTHPGAATACRRL